MVSEYDQLNWVVIHGRGVLNTGHGTTFARVLATGGMLSGRESCFYMRYDDSPERDNIPMIFYTVIGNPHIPITLHEEVEPVGEIFDAIVVMEPTLLISQTSQRALILDGAKKNSVLIVNSSQSTRQILELVKRRCLAQDWNGKLVAVRARKYDAEIAFPLLAALAKAWPCVNFNDMLDALDLSGASSKADIMRRVYSDVEPLDVNVNANEAGMTRTSKSKSSPSVKKRAWNINTYRSYQRAAAKATSYAQRMNAMPSWKTLPPGLIEFGPMPKEKNIGFTTSFARCFRPIIDKNRCTDCKMCSFHCPDGAIDFNRIEVDLDYCKGCGICAKICPSKAIRIASELFSIEKRDEKEVTTIEDSLVEYGY
jgi:2-oxoacid:acceptor oxidoreductase delta subunit (pyruvate/2-ketoisovalerate family)